MVGPEISSPPEGSTVVGDVRTNGGPVKMHAESPSVLPGKIEVTGQPARHDGIAHLQELYKAENWGDVVKFLTDHPALTPLLLEAHPRLHDIFAGSRTIRLRLVPGYEENEPVLLFADIVTTADPMLAFAQMNRFKDEWWLSTVTPAEGLLHFSVEFA